MTIAYETCLQTIDLDRLTMASRPPDTWYAAAVLFHVVVFGVIVWGFLASAPVQAVVASPSVLLEVVLKAAVALAVIQVVYRWWVGTDRGRFQRAFTRWTLVGPLEDMTYDAYLDSQQEILKASRRVSFAYAIQSLMAYAPELRQFRFLRIAALQRSGDLSKWLEDPQHIEWASQLVEALHRAEQRRDAALAGWEPDVF